MYCIGVYFCVCLGNVKWKHLLEYKGVYVYVYESSSMCKKV